MTPTPNPASDEPPESTSINARFRRDHQELEALFQVARQALAGEAAAAAHTALDRIWIRLAVHIRAEHKGLFPILGAARPDLLGELQGLREDHNFFIATLAGAVKAMEGPEPDFASARSALEAVERRLVPHDRMEETGIYFMADQIPLAQRRRIMAIVTTELAFLPERYER
jgi:hypothetical protein